MRYIALLLFLLIVIMLVAILSKTLIGTGQPNHRGYELAIESKLMESAGV